MQACRIIPKVRGRDISFSAGSREKDKGAYQGYAPLDAWKVWPDLLFELDEQIFGVNLTTWLGVNRFDNRVAFGVDTRFHFHGLD